MAAILAKDPGLSVSRKRGALGELRVTVDGKTVVDTNRMLYPTPSSVVRKVRASLASV